MADKQTSVFVLTLFGALFAAWRPGFAAQVAFRDDFNRPQLSEGWTIIREDPSTYSLTANPDFFRVQTVRGILGKEGTARNLLVRPMSGDFILDARLVFDPRDGQPFGGLLVYQDDAHAVAIGLVFASGARGEFRGVVMLNVGDDIDPAASPIAARYDETNAADPKVVYLRLLRQGDQFVGAYSEDGVNYRDLGTVTSPLADDISVGVGAGNGDSPSCGPACDASIPADFDYFQISTLDGSGNGGGTPVEVTLESVDISGPGDVVGGASADFTATARFSDGTSTDVTQDADWVVAPPDVGTIEGGVLSPGTFSAPRSATVVATLTQSTSSGTVTRTRAVVIRIVTASSQGGPLQFCGAGVAALLPLMGLPLLCKRCRRGRGISATSDGHGLSDRRLRE
jgi:regulation of enolase protein 1 (concanavalin A-like superfamily)